MKVALDASTYLPVGGNFGLSALHKAAEKCHGCELYKKATQVVFGEGQRHAEIFFIGEQPGDKEDLEGHPFVGPAGKLLDRALAEAKIDRSQVYVTNAVKHFKWEPRGKRRIHKKPNAREVKACFPWLEREILLVKPKAIVCLGATAGQSLFGSTFKISSVRGKAIKGTPFAQNVIATVHPSAILRRPDHESREQEFQLFVSDLKIAQAADKTNKNKVHL